MLSVPEDSNALCVLQIQQIARASYATLTLLYTNNINLINVKFSLFQY